MKKETLETYFRNQYSLVYRVAFMQLKCQADAEDAVQEVFIKLLRYRPHFQNDEHEKAWFIKTTINICKDMLKSKWNNTTVGIDYISESEKLQFFERSNLCVPGMWEDNTLWEVLELPEKYRNCLYFFYYEDYSVKEIAELLNLPENTIKTNLRRGREALKKLLENGGSL